MATRVLVADDHEIMREGLRALLANESDMEVVGEAANGREAVELASKLLPDAIVMDIAMPDLNGIDATRQIKAKYPDVKIIALSSHCDRRLIAGMLKAGASGYLLKHYAFKETVQAIRATAVAKQTYLSPGVAGVLVEDYVSHLSAEDEPAPSTLTSREREVLQLVAEGLSTKQVALRLRVSVQAVSNHRRQIMTKLGVESTAALTKYAIREGLTSLDF